MSESCFDENKLSAPLIICGMHRSGTSIASDFLARAGLKIGEDLNPAGPGNVRGHFENLDFVRFHERAFERSGHGPEGWILAPVPADASLRDEAHRLAAKHTHSSPWGWKDPRTTLLLDLWSDVLPSAKFLFMLRAPWEVADSLFRRGDAVFKNNSRFAIEVWMAYNKIVRDYVRLHPERSLIVNIDKLIDSPSSLIDCLRDQFEVALECPAEGVFDPALMKREPFAFEAHRELIERYFPEVVALFSELTACCPPLSESSRTNAEIDERRQLLADNRRLSKEVEGLRLRVDQLNSRLGQSAATLAGSRLVLQSTKCQLSQLRYEMKVLRDSRLVRLRDKGLRLKSRATGYLRKLTQS